RPAPRLVRPRLLAYPPFWGAGVCAPARRAGDPAAVPPRALSGLNAILRLHTVQEDEAYLSLGDDAETVGGGRL
ncbi:MAG: hypothetical protein ACHQCE_14895, partial [Streptosporangiales bacterium]